MPYYRLFNSKRRREYNTIKPYLIGLERVERLTQPALSRYMPSPVTFNPVTAP